MKKVYKILVFAVAIALLLIACADTRNSNEETDHTIICELEKFANISRLELVSILGEPDNIEATITNGYVELPCEYYEYNNAEELGEVSFILINDSVVKMISYHEYDYNDGEAILDQFKLVPNASCVSDEKESYSRYRCVTDKVDDLWITNIDKNNNTFATLQVTYDMFYFEEWYMTMDTAEESDYMTRTQEMVNGILVAPKTAKYPNILKWSFGKNPFYVAVKSYVDAQNSFGAEVRSEFLFFYTADTQNLVCAVFDNEIIMDNGYVESAELVEQLVDGAWLAGEFEIPEISKQNEIPIEKTEEIEDTITEPSEEERYEEYVESTMHAHVYGTWWGYSEYQHYGFCEICDDVEYRDHMWNEGEITQYPDCGHEGVIIYHCWDCEAESVELIGKMDDHEWDDGQLTREPTCSEEGIITYTCEVCGSTQQERVEKTEHDYSQMCERPLFLEKEATYTSGSVYYYSCVCGERGEETFSANDRIEWITTDQMRNDFNLSSGWFGESTLIIFSLSGSDEEYVVYDELRNGMGEDVYIGCYNGVDIRFFFNGRQYVFNYDDLVAAGIV